MFGVDGEEELEGGVVYGFDFGDFLVEAFDV